MIAGIKACLHHHILCGLLEAVIQVQTLMLLVALRRCTETQELG